jgi:membrane-associated phospholipid phosphatase
MQHVADAISLTHVVVFIAPAIAWWRTHDIFWVWMVIAQLFGGGVVTVLKSWIGGGNNVWGRPQGARGCDLWCVSGVADGEPGFPSGHMTAVSLFVAGVYWHTGETDVLLWGIPWITAMAWARWAKRCHSLLQIAGGIGLGSLIATLL